MRTIKTMMIAVLIGFSTNVLATTVLSNDSAKATLAVVEYKRTGIYKVIYKGEQTGKVRLSIYDAKHNLVYTDNLTKTSSFIKPFNFNGMAEGVYYIEVNSNNGKLVERVNYAAGKIEKTVNVTKLVGKDARYLLTVAAAEQDEIDVKIFDAADKLVHQEKRVVSGEFSQIYNLQNLHGSFTMLIADKSGIVKTIRY